MNSLIKWHSAAEYLMQCFPALPFHCICRSLGSFQWKRNFSRIVVGLHLQRFLDYLNRTESFGGIGKSSWAMGLRFYCLETM